MKPAILLIMLGSCVLPPACSSVNPPGKARNVALQHFTVTDLRIGNEPLAKALKRLDDRTRAISRDLGYSRKPMMFSIEGDSNKRVSANLDGYRLQNAIRLLALKADMEADFTGNVTRLTPFPEDPAVTTRRFQVPPTFQGDLPMLLHSGRSSTSSSSIRKILRDNDILQYRRSQAVYDPAKSILRVSSTGTDVRRVAALIHMTTGTGPVMIKHTCQRITFDQDPNLPTGVCSASEAESWLKRVLGSRDIGGDLDTLPSVTSRPGQPGTVEVIREHGTDRKWLGTKWRIKASPYGSGVISEIAYEQRVLIHEDQELSVPLPMTSEPIGPNPDLMSALNARHLNHTPVPVRDRKTQARLALPDHSFLIRKTTGSSKKTDYVLYSATLIDATGRRLTGEAP